MGKLRKYEKKMKMKVEESIFYDTMKYCEKFFECYNKNSNKKEENEENDMKRFNEYCMEKLGISAMVLQEILQEGDTGYSGRNIDEYYENNLAGIHMFGSGNWRGASKEEIYKAVMRLAYHYYKSDCTESLCMLNDESFMDRLSKMNNIEIEKIVSQR